MKTLTLKPKTTGKQGWMIGKNFYSNRVIVESMIETQEILSK